MKKTISNMEKVKLVLASFQGGTNVKKFCAQHGIPRSTFYRWRNLVLVGLSTFMPVSQKSPKASWKG
jgi:transposase-like protein